MKFRSYGTILGTGDPKVTIGPVTVGLAESLTFERCGKRQEKPLKNNVVDCRLYFCSLHALYFCKLLISSSVSSLSL